MASAGTTCFPKPPRGDEDDRPAFRMCEYSTCTVSVEWKVPVDDLLRMAILNVVAANLDGPAASVGVGSWKDENPKPVSVRPRIACLDNDSERLCSLVP